MQKLLVLLPAWFLFPLALFMGMGNSADADVRTQRKFGGYIRSTSFQSDYYTANFGLNLNNSWRLHAGEGVYFNSKVTFVNPEAGVTYMFLKGNLTPYLGASFENIAPGKNIGVSTSGLAADVGIDWTADAGLNLGAGALIPISSLTTVQLSVYAGWYF